MELLITNLEVLEGSSFRRNGKNPSLDMQEREFVEILTGVQLDKYQSSGR